MRYGPQVTAHRAATARGQEGLVSMLRIADRTEAEASRGGEDRVVGGPTAGPREGG
jgi:hypothetical protein